MDGRVWACAAVLISAQVSWGQTEDGGVDSTDAGFAEDAGLAVGDRTPSPVPSVPVDAGMPVVACRDTNRAVYIESVDGNGHPAPANVFKDGVLLGGAPQTIKLTSCDKLVRVNRLESEESRDVDLSQVGERVRINWDGRANHWAISAIVDFTLFDPPLRFLPAGVPPAAAVVGAGLRLERFGKYLHGTIALTANPLLTALPFFPGVPVLPSIDLLLGANWRPGTDRVRAILSTQLGLVQVIYPTLRGTAGVLLWERLLVTVSLDARLFLPRFLMPGFERLSMFNLGVSAAVGVAL